ncbi:NAD-dependent protein deacylase [Fusobacterium pseudoperiodonticum]|uniref:NAD-dependent protein deacetylase n=1 Tax=Fusobacterium pseudoperiodonticum TaxID=2663009 RepID=A0A2D3P7R0_9FUSO|nr:NAD-dependent protein deacylase [Fusobacterium pseudoperiodonticum]ATV58594.1 NAD-dependent protein deacylase [Fusobacterium pseudoperiodonticum]ATV63650.1 NAD-dependent protein deacylase [Fusobacterium pseudoperiodonticum]
MENKIEKLADIIKNSKHLVFFTGAGVSTESGLKSFRGKDGLYSSLYKGKYRPEEVLSSDFFCSHRKIFIEYVEEELNINGIKPNKGHLALAELERRGILKAVITQNIDDLHQMAGNKNVLELHGSLKRWYCLSCGKTSNKNFSCDCGGIVRPDVTLYGENLNQDVVNEAIYQIEQADTLIVAGTSLTVYPAAYYLRYFRGKNLVIINNESTQYDGEASLVLKTNFADTMEKVLNIIKK